jgi:DNA polymerase elongation subunit (family B)
MKTNIECGVKIDMIIEYMIRDNKPIIHMFWTDDEGIRHHETDDNFLPYFYVNIDEHVPNDQRILKVEEGEFYSIFGGKVKKIYTNLPSDVKDIRMFFKKTYEADVLFPTRYMIDKIDVIKGKLKVATVDIETDDSQGMPDVEKAEQEMYSCSIHDSFTGRIFALYWRRDLEAKIFDGEWQGYKVTYITHSNEKDFLNELAACVERIDPDIITAWNVGFDVPYIIKRMQNVGADADRLSPLRYVVAEREKIHGRAVFDMLAGYKKLKLKEMRNYKLDYVSEVELGKHKIQHDETITELWKDNIVKLIEYNINDTALVVELNKKLNIIGLYDDIRRLTKTDFNRVLNYSVSVDCAVLSYCKGRFVLPTKRKALKKRKIEGALVITPSKGLYKDVIVCDITRTYPSAMITCNISPETYSKEGDIIVEGDLRFVSSPKGVVPSVLYKLIELRNEKKKLMNQYAYGSEEYTVYYTQQFALKSLINSFYGVLAFEDFRLYDQRVASAVTNVGRQLIKWCMRVASDNKYKVIYGDTDSIFIEARSENIDDVINEGKDLKDKICKSFDDFAIGLGVKKHVFDLDFDKVFSSLIFIGVKKKYAGKLAWTDGKKTDKMKIVGFECIRSDTTKVTKNIQENLFRIMTSGSKLAKMKDDVYYYLRDELDKIKKKKYNLSELGFPTAIRKEASQYKVRTMALRASQNSAFIGKNYKVGDKPLMIPIRKVPQGFPAMDVIMIDDDKDLPKGFEPDFDEIINKSVRMKVEDIIGTIGLGFDEVITGKTQSTLW